jgi:hypothetical protein
MAKDSKTAPAVTSDYIVASGQLVTGPKRERKVYNVGEGYTPANEAERDELLARGLIMAGADFARLAGGATVVTALQAAEARAAAAEEELAKLKAPAAPAAPTAG